MLYMGYSQYHPSSPSGQFSHHSIFVHTKSMNNKANSKVTTLTFVTTIPEANVLLGDSYGASGLNLNAIPLSLHSQYSWRLTVAVYA